MVISEAQVRVRALAVSIALLLVPAALIWIQRDITITEWKDRILNTASMLEGHADQAFSAADLIATNLVEDLDEQKLTSRADLVAFARRDKVFENIVARASSLPQVDVVTIAAADGEVLNFSRSFPPPPINLGDRDYFKAHLADPKLDFYLSQPVQNRGNGKWTFYLTRKIRSSQGETLGLLLVGLKVDHLLDYYSQVQIAPEHSITILRSDGVVLTRYPQRSIGDSYVNSVTFSMILNKGSQGVVYTDTPRISPNAADPTERIVAARAFKSFPAIISTTATSDLFLRKWWNYATTVGLIGLLASIAVYVAITRWYGQERVRMTSMARINEMNAYLTNFNVVLEDKVKKRTQELADANRALEKLSYLDPLTKLMTNSSFEKHVVESLSLYVRGSQPIFSLLIVDVDHFGAMNDTHGPERCDLLLRQLAEFLKKECRPSDVIARIGGEEFGVYLARTDQRASQAFAERLTAHIAQHDFDGIKLSVSIGSTAVAASDNLKAILSRATPSVRQLS